LAGADRPEAAYRLLAPPRPAAELDVRHQRTHVSNSLETLKTELERFGEVNDAAKNERPRRMLNITRDTGEFLGVKASS
jgi:hypothetical protein